MSNVKKITTPHKSGKFYTLTYKKVHYSRCEARLITDCTRGMLKLNKREHSNINLLTIEGCGHGGM